MVSTKPPALVTVGLVGFGSVLAYWLLKGDGGYSDITFGSLFDPKAVAAYSQTLPKDEDQFIVQAWQDVGARIQYSGYGSIMTFTPNVVHCQKCLLPSEVVKEQHGNCVAKSVLLVSVLRNRIPANRLFMVVGNLMGRGEDSGHAWVQVQRRDGNWYLIEATMTPPANPWLPVVDTIKEYVPDAMLNDQELICYDKEICATTKLSFTVAAGKCPCQAQSLTEALSWR